MPRTENPARTGSVRGKAQRRAFIFLFFIKIPAVNDFSILHPREDFVNIILSLKKSKKCGKIKKRMSALTSLVRIIDDNRGKEALRWALTKYFATSG